MWMISGVSAHECWGGGPEWRSAWFALRRAPWRRWWLCLLVVWATRGVAVGGSGSLHVLSSGVAPIHTWGTEVVAPTPKVSCGTGSRRAKALRFVADGCGRRSLPEDVVVVLLVVAGFRVKTFVLYGLRHWRRLVSFSLPRMLSWSLSVLRCGATLYSDLPLSFFGSVVFT